MEAGVEVRVPNLPPPDIDSAASSDPSLGVSDSDFGHWLLVSRQRGLSRSRGGRARAPTTAPRSAADPQTENRASRGATAHSTRGGLCGRASGRLPISHSTLHSSLGMDLTAPDSISDPPGNPAALPTVPGESGMRFSNAPQEPPYPTSPSYPAPSSVQSKTNPSPTPQLHSTPRGIRPLDQRSRSPPPVLMQSISDGHSPRTLSLSQDHSRLVDQVSAALDEGSMEEDSGHNDDDSVEFDDQMSEEDEPDDMMTLDQFQEETRREALIRKGSLLAVETQKKGRVEKGEPRPS